MPLERIRALAASLPHLTGSAPQDGEWGEALYGAWLCGTVVGQVGMALHHKLCHALGTGFSLPHAETPAVILPHAVAHTKATVPDLLRPVADILGTATAFHGLDTLPRHIGAPVSLGADGGRPAVLRRSGHRQRLRESKTDRAKAVAALLARALAGDAAQT